MDSHETPPIETPQTLEPEKAATLRTNIQKIIDALENDSPKPEDLPDIASHQETPTT